MNVTLGVSALSTSVWNKSGDSLEYSVSQNHVIMKEHTWTHGVAFPFSQCTMCLVFLYMLLLSAWYFIFEYIWLTGNGRLGGRYCSSVQNLPGAGRTRREGQWTGQKKNQ